MSSGHGPGHHIAYNLDQLSANHASHHHNDAGSRAGRDAPARMVLGVSLFSALSCLAGGLELVIWRSGNRYSPPLDVLRFTPFHDFLLPGL